VELLVREARPEDGAAVSRIYAPYVTETPITFEEEIPDAAEMSQRIRDTQAKYPYLVAELDGQVVGYAYATAFRTRASYRWGVELAIYLDRACHRRGIGRTLCNILLSLLKAQGFAIAYAGITIPNSPSVGLFEALGFSRVGVFNACGYKFDSWHDVGFWELRITPTSTTTREPILWPAMPRFTPVTKKLSPT
jgi:phosphinothricin acetyltransferase